MSDFKIGNRVLCKNTFVTNYRKDNNVIGQMIHFFKGRYYIIIDYKFLDNEWQFIFKSELSEHCRLPEKSLYNWFYCEKELRKLKLNKINKLC